MSQLDLYNKKKSQLLQYFSQSCAIMNDLGMSKEVSMCVSLDRKLRSNTFKVVVVGEFKVGKSTFINALLGGDVLPAKSTPCTAVINEIKYSTDKYAVVYFKHPIPAPLPALAPNVKKYIEKYGDAQVPPIKIKVDDLKHFVVINDEAEDQKEGVAQNPFSKAEIYWNLPICEKGIEIIDSPGLGENLVRTDVTSNYLSQADAIIFVFSATTPISMDEMSVIQNDIQGAGHICPIFVCNKFDLVKPQEHEEFIKHIYGKLRDKTQLGEKGICFLNAEAAKNARENGDDTALQQSGMLQFEAVLDSFLANKRGTLKLMQPTTQLESMIEKAIAEVVPNEFKMLTLSVDEIDRRLQRELPNLEQLKRRRDILKRQVDTEIDTICRNVEQQLKTRYQSIITDMPETVNSITCTNTISFNPFKIKESIKSFCEELIEKLQNNITNDQKKWQSSSFEPFISKELSRLSEIFESSVKEIFVDVERIRLRISGSDDSDIASTSQRVLAGIAGFFSGGIWGAVTGGSLGFSPEFIRTIVAEIAIGATLGALLGATNPITLIALTIASLVGIIAGISNIETRVRERISNAVIDQVRKDKDESISKAIKLFRDRLVDGSSSIYNAINDEISSVEKLVESIRNDKIAGEERIKIRTQKLTEDNKQLKYILTNIQALIKSMENGDIEFTPLEDNLPPQQPQEPIPPQNSKPPHNNAPEPPTPQQPVAPAPQPIPAPAPLPNPVPEPTPSKPEFVIAPGTESFEKDGVIYYRLNNSHHADDDCGGEMFVGDNAHLVCGKCGMDFSIEFWKVIFAKYAGIETNNLRHTKEKQNLDELMQLVGDVIKDAGIKWFRKYMDSVTLGKEI